MKFWGVLLSFLFAILILSGCRKAVEVSISDADAKWVKVFRDPAIDVVFSSPQNGAVLTYGQLVTSTNGGLTWNYFLDNVNKLFNLGMGSDTTIAVTGGKSVLFVYGINKTTKSFITNDTLLDCYYMDPSTCIVNGTKNIWITRNSGRSLERVLSTDSINKESLGAYKTIAKLTNSRFWVARSSGNLFETRDKGLTWNKVNLTFNKLNTIQMLSEQIGYYTDMSGLFKTINGGASWQSLNTDAVDVHFFNTNVGYITTKNNEFLKTTDGGATWKQIFNLKNERVVELFFIDENNGWVSTSLGVYKKVK